MSVCELAVVWSSSSLALLCTVAGDTLSSQAADTLSPRADRTSEARKHTTLAVEHTWPKKEVDAILFDPNRMLSGNLEQK